MNTLHLLGMKNNSFFYQIAIKWIPKMIKYSIYIYSLLLLSCGISKKKMLPPDISSYSYEIPTIVSPSDSLSYFKNDYLLRNKYNIWELYVSGNAYQIGITSGALTQKLYQRQDSIFFDKLKTFVTSKRKQYFLHKFIKWFNRDINQNIIKPLQVELYGQSHYSDSAYNTIASAYERSLYLHSAHDIGHALRDLMLVGCSSLAVWDAKSADGKLLIGRNFDFFLSDDFASEKIIKFVRPDKGIPFVSYAWGGMAGILSGMNLEGLTVSINAGKSDIPLKARTPISLLCREILQYASTIEEAIAIARKRKVFVSEAIMIGSAKDRKAIIIEVSPNTLAVYEVENRSSLICTNHFQSTAYQNNKKHKKHLQNSHSVYRFERISELLERYESIDATKMASILRNTEGLHNTAIGYGNEKALNQLLAHHAIIFKPEDKIVWVSTSPYQLGNFIAYDLNRIFNTNITDYKSHSIDSLIIPKSDFMNTQMYKNYEKYRALEQQTEQQLKNNIPIAKDDIIALLQYNPDYWKGYYIAGKNYYQQRNYLEASKYFDIALRKEIPYKKIEDSIKKYLRKCKNKIHN